MRTYNFYDLIQILEILLIDHYSLHQEIYEVIVHEFLCLNFIYLKGEIVDIDFEKYGFFYSEYDETCRGIWKMEGIGNKKSLINFFFNP